MVAASLVHCKWYAVRVGRKTGIFRTWEECAAQVNGYSCSVFKSFESRREAEQFCNGGGGDQASSYDDDDEEAAPSTVRRRRTSDILRKPTQSAVVNDEDDDEDTARPTVRRRRTSDILRKPALSSVVNDNDEDEEAAPAAVVRRRRTSDILRRSTQSAVVNDDDAGGSPRTVKRLNVKTSAAAAPAGATSSRPSLPAIRDHKARGIIAALQAAADAVEPSYGADITDAPQAYQVNFDGASKGNPGPSGCGAVITDIHTGQQVAEVMCRIPDGTNNEAEYSAACLGLMACLALGITAPVAVGDSELVVKQINGEYNVNATHLLAYRDTARALMRQLSKGRHKTIMKHVKRERNREADRLSAAAVRMSQQDEWM